MKASTNMILHQDSKLVVRGGYDDKGDFCLYVHAKVEHKEVPPRGYWLGSNALIWKGPPKPVK